MDTSVLSLIVLHGKSVSDLRLLYPCKDGSMAPFATHAGTVLKIPNLPLLEFSPAQAFRPPTAENFQEHFLAYGLTPAKWGAIIPRSILD